MRLRIDCEIACVIHVNGQIVDTKIQVNRYQRYSLSILHKVYSYKLTNRAHARNRGLRAFLSPVSTSIDISFLVTSFSVYDSAAKQPVCSSSERRGIEKISTLHLNIMTFVNTVTRERPSGRKM